MTKKQIKNFRAKENKVKNYTNRNSLFWQRKTKNNTINYYVYYDIQEYEWVLEKNHYKENIMIKKEYIPLYVYLEE